jgi:hypothetical protein
VERGRSPRMSRLVAFLIAIALLLPALIEDGFFRTLF